MASSGRNQGGLRKASSFEVELQKFSSYVAHLGNCINDSQTLLKTLQEAFSIVMTDTEKKQLGHNLGKKSTILVVGQTNSGKSSLVNELLGGSFLPTAEVPCTSRIVRLKYSEQNYVQLLDKAGRKMGEATLFRKKIPKNEIVLEDKKKTNDELVNQVVEVGINNSFLQDCHLEFVDAPGMSENEALDKIVEECLDGVLQVVIYVIDGNSSLRFQERRFLQNLKERMGNQPIFFVCNKVDRNQKAADFDRNSDDDEGDDEEATKRIIHKKTNLSYKRLVENGCLSDDVEPEECGVFHAVSTKQVREARREDVTNQYTMEFGKMKSKLLNFAVASINSHLKSAAGLLSQIQQRVFDFLLSESFKHDPKTIQDIFDKLKSKETEYNGKMNELIDSHEIKIGRSVAGWVEEKREQILSSAETMEFIHDTKVPPSECRRQIQTLVQMHVKGTLRRKYRDTINEITDTLKKSVLETFDKVSTKSEMMGEIVKRNLCNCILLYHQTDQTTDDDKVHTELINQAADLFKDHASTVRGTTISKEWKRKVAENAIANIDNVKAAKWMLSEIRFQLKESHAAFPNKVKIIQRLCDEKSKGLSFDQRKCVVATFPLFAEQMCKTEALLQSLSPESPVKLEDKVETGHRGVVYGCSVYSVGDVVAKQLHERSCRVEYLAVQYALKRVQDDCKSILRPVSLRLDFQNRVTILLPKMDMNLYDALAAGRVKDMGMSTRLAIVLQVTDACDFSRHSGLYHVDPRITSILLDKQNAAKLNVCKTRDDHVPYPDHKAPFHVPKEKPADHASTESYLGHNLYSLGVLLWLLLRGEYCRPKYADTTKVEEVYSEVASGVSPDVSCLVDREHREALKELLLFAWHAWRNDTPDLSNFQERLSKLHSQTGF